MSIDLETMNLNIKNVLFKCSICLKSITSADFYTLNDQLPKIPDQNLNDALMVLTNINSVTDNLKSISKTCSSCLHNADATLRFILLCDKAVENHFLYNNYTYTISDEFTRDVKELCVVCNRKLENFEKISIQRLLPVAEPALTFWNALKLLSDFEKLECLKIPQDACYICFLNTESCVHFISLCNKALKGEENNEEITKTDPKATSTKETRREDKIKRYGCKLCTESFSSNIKLTKHLSDGHCKDANNEPTDTRKEACKYCGKLYSPHYIRFHMRKHTGEAPYKCNKCNLRFVAPHDIKRHRAQHHSTEYPFLCSICGAKFKYKPYLNRHMETHGIGTKSRTCEICGKILASTKKLLNHYRSHSDERKFSCEHCSKCFKAKKHLKQHLVTHAKIPPIGCSFCGKRFTQRHCLKTHLAKSCKGTPETEQK